MSSLKTNMPSAPLSGDGITIKGLIKRYPRTRDFLQWLRRPLARGSTTALAGVDLEIPRGGVTALLGPNGAGKTTLLKVLSGLALPDAGEIRVDGEDLTGKADQLRRRMGLVVSDERSFYWRLSVFENLKFFAKLQGLRGEELRDRVAAVLAAVDLEDRANCGFQSLSTGMRQRLAIARGLLPDPSILFLDEPTRSLDPESAARVHEQVDELLEQDPNRLILYSTHNLEEAEQISQRVIVIREGRVVRQRNLGELDDGRRAYTYELRTTPRVCATLLEQLGIDVIDETSQSVIFEIDQLEQLDPLIETLARDGLRLRGLTERNSTLREFYLESAEAVS